MSSLSYFEVYSWLTEFDNSSYLSVATREMAMQLTSSLRPFKREKVFNWIDRLIEISSGCGINEEIAETYVVCASAAYQINALKEAKSYLQAAERMYSDHDHQVAVVKWLSGTICWAQSSATGGREALVLMQESIYLFEKCRDIQRENKQKSKEVWYEEKLDRMRQTLISKARSIGSRISILSDKEENKTTDIMPISNQKINPEEDWFSVLFQAFSVSETVPASGFGPAGYDRNPFSYVEIDRVIIDDRTFYIRPLNRNGKVVKLSKYINLGRRLAVVKVKGDSMNRTNIFDGDYVLISIQDEAENGEIIVAGRDNTDAEATIKRFVREKGSVILRPESTNPIHQDIVITPEDKFRIIGVAVAVFKPYKDN